VITLVAVVTLFVVGAMAALSIDVVTIYTARSEAQLAADGAALAAARVLANSGATSDPNSLGDGVMTSAQTLASAIATQVAEQNQVGGVYLTGIPAPVFGGTGTNPTVTVSVQVTSLPTFFARIWGTKFLTVGASATAEAYNPSGAGTTPVAPSCVKPWLLPNIDPTDAAKSIFNKNTGAISNPALLGWTSGTPLQTACTNCTSPPPLPTPTAWNYYPGNTTTSFPSPQAVPTCAPAMTTAYEQSVSGCVQTAIACNSSTLLIDTSDYPTRKTETADAVNCLTHAKTNEGDRVDPTYASPPFEFLAGNDNPITGLAGNDVMVSDSLVTVPVFNSTTGMAPTNPVTIIGFVQLFLNPNGMATPTFGMNRGKVNTTIINMAGCGTGASGTPILGNGASPVAVRLISP
jgi:Flp pilus assembly protein TadG